MFFINKKDSSLTIKSAPPYSTPFDKNLLPDYQVLNNIKFLNVVGNSSVFDNYFETFVDNSTVSFIGKHYFHFNEALMVELYELENDSGFLYHDIKNQCAYVSRSLSLLNNYCLSVGSSLIELMKLTNPTIKVETYICNNQFSIKPLDEKSINHEEHSIFYFGWAKSLNEFEFGALIDDSSFVAKKGMFANKYSGHAVNIGNFEQTIVVQIDEDASYPDYFPEAEYDRCVIFSNLIDSNAQSVLVPNIMSLDEYRFMISEAYKAGRQNLTYSGLSNLGYSIEVSINIPNEEARSYEGEALVTQIILSPEVNLVANYNIKARSRTNG